MGHAGPAARAFGLRQNARTIADQSRRWRLTGVRKPGPHQRRTVRSMEAIAFPAAYRTPQDLPCKLPDTASPRLRRAGLLAAPPAYGHHPRCAGSKPASGRPSPMRAQRCCAPRRRARVRRFNWVRPGSLAGPGPDTLGMAHPRHTTKSRAPMQCDAAQLPPSHSAPRLQASPHSLAPTLAAKAASRYSVREQRALQACCFALRCPARKGQGNHQIIVLPRPPCFVRIMPRQRHLHPKIHQFF